MNEDNKIMLCLYYVCQIQMSSGQQNPRIPFPGHCDAIEGRLLLDIGWFVLFFFNLYLQVRAYSFLDK